MGDSWYLLLQHSASKDTLDSQIVQVVIGKDSLYPHIVIVNDWNLNNLWVIMGIDGCLLTVYVLVVLTVPRL